MLKVNHVDLNSDLVGKQNRTVKNNTSYGDNVSCMSDITLKKPANNTVILQNKDLAYVVQIPVSYRTFSEHRTSQSETTKLWV